MARSYGIEAIPMSVPLNVIPIARAGRPDFKFTTTYPIDSALTTAIAAHANQVEADRARPAPVKLLPYYERWEERCTSISQALIIKSR
jgi:hypothetical protein